MGDEKVVHEWEYEWTDSHKTKYGLVQRKSKYYDTEPCKYMVDILDGSLSGKGISAFPPIVSEIARLAERVKELEAVAESAEKVYEFFTIGEGRIPWPKMYQALKNAKYLKDF